MPSTHSHDDLDLFAAELDVIEADLRLREHEADVLASLIPKTATRGLHPHERRAAVNFATIDVEARQRADRLAQQLHGERAWLAGAVDEHLIDATTATEARARLARLADPVRPLSADLPAVAGRQARLEANALGELRGAYEDGWRQVAAEARAQGLPTPRLDTVTASTAAGDTFAAQASTIAARPYVTGVAAAAQAAARSTTQDVEQVRRAAVTAARDEGLDGLATDHARAPIAQATGAGRQAAGETQPTASTIYASELLDGSTCGPCSLVDGREYATIDDARLDYPSGTYVNCDGGSRCRGTLVFVWNTEADPTIDDVVRPGPEAPPLGPTTPPPAAPTGTTIGPNLPTPPAPVVPDLTRDEQAAQEKAARLAARRAAAAADREAERAGLDRLVTEDGYTPEEVADARRDVDLYRARAQAEARRIAASITEDLGQVNTRRMATPPPLRRVRDPHSGQLVTRRVNADGTFYTGGEYDWLESISQAERKRLSRSWFTPSGAEPDVLADAMNGGTATKAADTALTADDGIARWLDANRRIDGYNSLAAGYTPLPEAIGGIDLPLVDSPYGALNGDVVEATRTLLARTAEDAETFAARAAADEALNAGELARLGPTPWDMSEDAFATEVADVEARYAEADLTPVVADDPALGRPRYNPDVEQLLARYAELVPDDFASLDLAPRDLYRSIVAWARQAGLIVERFAA